MRFVCKLQFGISGKPIWYENLLKESLHWIAATDMNLKIAPASVSSAALGFQWQFFSAGIIRAFANYSQTICIPILVLIHSDEFKYVSFVIFYLLLSHTSFPFLSIHYIASKYYTILSVLVPVHL